MIRLRSRVFPWHRERLCGMGWVMRGSYGAKPLPSFIA
jgi:hypothetical protein